MSERTEKQGGAEVAQPQSAQADSSFSFPNIAGAVFLMINSFETGGTERQFLEIARSLKSNSFVHLGCIQKKGYFLPDPGLDGFGEVIQFGLGGSLYGLQSIRTRWRLMHHLRDLQIEVAHAFDFYTNLTLIPAARLARVPVIGSHRQVGDLLTEAQFRVQLAMFRWCKRVVCNSRAAAERLLRAGLEEEKVIVIGNGLPPAAFAAHAPVLERRDGVIRVGMIARMNAGYKNHAMFLRAAARLTQRFSNLEFVLVGDGPLRPQLEQQAAELGCRRRVHFLGERRDIPAILASLDVSVVPSASESLSNVILESMAAGVPVVATAVGGNNELGEDERLLLVPADEMALAAGLTRVLSDAEFRSAMARRAQRFASDNFRIERVRQQYCKLYAETIASRGKRSRRLFKSSLKPQSCRPIRIAIVAPTLRYVGGQAVQADLLLKNWRDDSHVHPVFVPVDPNPPRGFGWVQRIPGLRTFFREPRYLLSLWRRLGDADVVHIFSASYSSFLLAPLPAWFVARIRGKKTLINYRSGECRDHLRRSSIARHVLKRTDKLVVPSGYLVDVLRDFGLTATAIPNIVDVSQFSFRIRRPLRPHLICTRGFHPYYSIDIVVRAFAKVQERYPEAQLDLVGGGPLEQDVRNLVRELKLAGVDFKGVAARANIGRYYDQADIFINASRLDNMPVSILEAFASGMPVVTTEPEGMRYFVEHGSTGLLSPPGDPESLAQNVIRVLQDAELAHRLVSNAAQEFQRYSWGVVRAQWLDVYRALASVDESKPGNSADRVDSSNLTVQ